MQRNLLVPLTLWFAVPAAACVDPPGGSGDANDVSSAIEQPGGGLDTSDEAPAFGADAELAAAAIEDASLASDPLAADPATLAMDRASAATGFRVTLVWGKLPADPGAKDARTWTGSLTLSRGGMIVRRTIGFEDATDKLLPRVALDTVSFQSVTRPYVDGLALTVLDPMPSATATQTLTYTPADGSTSYALDLAQLAAGPITIDAGGGFQIIAIGHRRQATACDGGFMRGRWHALSPQLGKFLGVVTDEDGAPVGHVRGVYGERRDGDAVVFGKFIDRDGHFRGLLDGTFGNGEYQARWIDRQGDHGAAHGVYFEGATPTAGMFLGRWAETSCSADPVPTSP